MNIHVAAQVCGAIGDLLNLVGTWILARDLIDRKNEQADVEERNRFAEALQKLGADVPVSDEGVPATQKDIALHLVVQAVLRGRRGFRFMVAGFAFLLLYRILGMLSLHN